MRSRILLAAAMVFGLGAAGCNEGIDLPTQTPTDPPTEVPTEIPTELPTELPSGAGSLSTGTAHMDITGDITLSVDLPLTGSGIFAPPPGAIGLTYADETGTSFGVGGTSFVGSETTSETLVVSVGVLSEDFFGIFVSGEGECTVTVDEGSEEAVSGSVSCAGLTSADTTVDLEATFSAEA